MAINDFARRLLGYDPFASSQQGGQPAAGGMPTNTATLAQPTLDQFYEEDLQRAQMGRVGNLGMMLLAASQNLTPAQRATILAQAPQYMDGAEKDAMTAAQARLFDMSTREKRDELSRQTALADRVRKDPTFATSIGLTPDLLSTLSPAEIADVVKTRATRNPLDDKLKQAQIYHYLNPTTTAPTPQLVDLPGGGKAWAMPGSSEVTPIGGAGKGGIDPETAKRSEGEGKALTYAKEAITSNVGLTKPNVAGALTNKWQKRANMLPTVGASSWAGNDYVAGDRAGNSFIDSVIRPRSGATVPPDELERNKQVFTPQPGDTADVLLQKAQMRAQHIQSLIAEANPADRPMLMKMFEDSQREILSAYQGNGQRAAPVAAPGVRSIVEIK